MYFCISVIPAGLPVVQAHYFIKITIPMCVCTFLLARN